MKSILIIGTADAGKSTTMREVCRRLKPTKVYKLLPDTKIHKNSKLQDSDVEKIFNNTFIIEVKEKLILVVAGAPTEQRIRLKILIEI
jgi:ABC-type multidrug transport system ATPase subunit